ncbi:MAG TPA: alpha/beta fold hydrolase [Longimicrobiales bacterium]|nr:alpha/beta fold hydrolase [Longimicrobiales bacterium]
MKHHHHGAVMLGLTALFACSDHTPTGPGETFEAIDLVESAATGVAFDHFVPNATGHEWANSYLLALLSHYSYVPLVGATGDADFLATFASHFAPLGLTDFRVIQDPLTDAEVVLAETDDALFVVFRGTEADPPRLDFELRDIWIDLSFVMVDYMHNGFNASARRVIDLVRGEIESTPGKRVWLTGHSLGGALATMTAQLLHAESGITVDGVYTYGSPRVFGDVMATRFDETFGARSQRWVNNRDPVPHVAGSIPLLLPYQHVRVLNNIIPAGSGCIVQRDDEEIQFITQEQWDQMLSQIDLTDMSTWGTLFESILALGDLGDHDTGRYASRIYASMSPELRAAMPEPPYPAGSDNSCDNPQDSSPPSIAPVTSGTLGDAGWYVSDVAISWNIIDDESEIDATEGCTDRTVTSDTDGVTFTCTATSGGGTTTESLTIRRDATAPMIAITSPPVGGPDYLLGQQVPAEFTCSDEVSGLASCEGTTPDGMPLPTSAFGSHQLGVTAQDEAGNTATDSRGYSITYGFDGFYEPVENLPAANIARAGQRIPFKWRLLDAAGSVTDRTDLFHVTWSDPATCSGVIAGVDLSGATGESTSGIRWDADAQQYIFVAVTNRSDAGMCRYLNVGVGAHGIMRGLVQFR